MSIFTPKVLFRFISQAQKFNNSVFLAFSRWQGIKKNGTDLYLVCSFTFKFPAVASKFFLRYRGGIFLQCPVTSGRRKNFKIFRSLPGIQYIFALHHVNKPGKFQLGIVNPHLFTFICFQCVSTQAQNCPQFALNFRRAALFSSSLACVAGGILWVRD